MKKPIAIGLSPNAQKDDVLLAAKNLLVPLNYQKGKSVNKLEEWFKTYFKTSYSISFQNGRSALFAILSALGIGKNDEVVLQAFTCVVVPNAIIATGAKPIYSDINDSLVIDPDDIEKKITKKTKAIIIQHTFGIPTDMHAVMKIAKEYNLFVIEDVAHTIGGNYKEKKLGTFGIASIFSFGRDKAFSSVFGGMVITADKELGKKLLAFQKKLPFPSKVWVIQQLFYPLTCAFILNFYYVFLIGKIIHFLLRKINFFSFPVDKQEREGKFSSLNVKRFPNSLASLAFLQLNKLDKYNQKRKNFVQQYLRQLKDIPVAFPYNGNESLMRFPVLVDDKTKVKNYFFRKGIYIGDWYNQAIDPVDINLASIFYESGMCPKAEHIAKHIINLPTNPTLKEKDIMRAIKVLKEYYGS